jgi:hypothetical protein
MTYSVNKNSTNIESAVSFLRTIAFVMLSKSKCMLLATVTSKIQHKLYDFKPLSTEIYAI